MLNDSATELAELELIMEGAADEGAADEGAASPRGPRARIAEWGVKRERLARVSSCGENVKSAYIIGAGSILPAVGPSWGDLQPYSERAGCRVRCLGGAMK